MTPSVVVSFMKYVQVIRICGGSLAICQPLYRMK